MADATAAPGFEVDIKPLFREKDKRAMDSWFDLWSYGDVKENAEAILERLEEGDMPCDGAWMDERLELFRSWMTAGMAP